MRALRFILGLILLGVGAVGVSAVRDQLQRDQVCVAAIDAIVRAIEAFREERGRLPATVELPGPASSVLSYRVLPATDVQREQYAFAWWRGEWGAEYSSATRQNTCDSGATQAGTWLAAVLLPPLLGLALWERRARRKARAS